MAEALSECSTKNPREVRETGVFQATTRSGVNLGVPPELFPECNASAPKAKRGRPLGSKNRIQREKPKRKKPDIGMAQKLYAILQKQDFRCAITGDELTPETARPDHKVPVSRGGAHGVENIQWLHAEVNRAKGNMLDSEFIAMCRRVVWWAEHGRQDSAASTTRTGDPENTRA